MVRNRLSNKYWDAIEIQALSGTIEAQGIGAGTAIPNLAVHGRYVGAINRR